MVGRCGLSNFCGAGRLEVQHSAYVRVWPQTAFCAFVSYDYANIMLSQLVWLDELLFAALLVCDIFQRICEIKVVYMHVPSASACCQKNVLSS